jgi:hypothetical protein
MPTLVPCPGCARHVRANETACPFCDAAIGEPVERVFAPIANDRLFTRAALTFATVAATSLTACGKESTDKPPPAPTNTADPGPVPVYGPAPMPTEEPKPAPTTTTSSTAAPTASSTTSAAPRPKPGPSGMTAAPAYGVPPINKTPTPPK